jgi:hypothetical protein
LTHHLLDSNDVVVQSMEGLQDTVLELGLEMHGLGDAISGLTQEFRAFRDEVADANEIAREQREELLELFRGFCDSMARGMARRAAATGGTGSPERGGVEGAEERAKTEDDENGEGGNGGAVPGAMQVDGPAS